MPNREHIWQRFVNWWTTRKVALALLTTSLLGGVLGYINQHSGLFITIPFVTDFYANASTELISIAITVLVIDTLNDRRAVQQEKDALILQMSSPINSVAREAVRMLRTRGWLTDGTLRGINLRWANLQDAYLEGANLPDTNLFRARLQGAHLQWSNLEGAMGLKDEQLVHLHNLRGARMPDGTVYDGRYNLKRDLSWMRLFVVDTGETARTTSEPGYFSKWHPYYRFAVRFNVQPEDEIGPQMRRLGSSPDEVAAVILTHLHTDHSGGMVHFPSSRFLIHPGEWQATMGFAGWLNGYLRPRWPGWLQPQFMQFAPEALGPFAESCAVTKDGRIRILPTPGHTPHHVSVVVQTDDVTYFLAGDTSYTQMLMQQGIPDGVGTAESTHTLRLIRQFTSCFPTVYLPSHEINAERRLNKKIM